jgi:hypothetical protein
MSVICSRRHSTKISCEVMVNPNTKEFIHFTDDAFDYGWRDNCGNGQALVDTEETTTSIDKAFHEYKTTYGKEPLYAVCGVRFKNDDSSTDMLFKLSIDVGDDDDEIFFYCNNIKDLKLLAEPSSEDFLITGFDYFYKP